MRQNRVSVRATGTRRGGFTMVELLMAMGVILILFVLLAGAVMRVMAQGPQTLTRQEMSMFDVAIAGFKADHNNVDYIPSTIILREDMAYSTAAELTSLAWLKKAFGKRLGAGVSFVDWNGDGSSTPGAITLTGDQCLVFFLGGIPSTSGGVLATKGFSTDPTNPANFTAGVNIKKPYFDFHSNRLKLGTNGFLSYLDPYPLTSGKPARQPYVYFSTYKNGNDYQPSDVTTSITAVAPYYVAGTFVANSTPPPAWSSIKFLNPNSYQIISAGADNTFGFTPDSSGCQPWNPAAGYGQGVPGTDDQASFSGSLLGAPQK
jgi:prepilin-type N-terminal cleavage/methylation domain-containing protein